MPNSLRRDDTERLANPRICIRNLRMTDLDAAVALHESVISDGFLASCGSSFLKSYYRAWIRSGSSIALTATADGSVVGLLLGSLSPARHYRSMVRRDGAATGMRLIARSVRRPGWGFELLRSRGWRYLRGVLKMILSQRSDPSRAQQLRPGLPGGKADQLCLNSGWPTPGTDERRLGEITHLMVAAAAQSRSVGRGLVKEMCRLAENAELELLVAVALPGSGAERFYSRLGWIRRGEMMTRSRERFVRYELTLPASARIDPEVKG